MRPGTWTESQFPAAPVYLWMTRQVFWFIGTSRYQADQTRWVISFTGMSGSSYRLGAKFDLHLATMECMLHTIGRKQYVNINDRY